jgi:hypothetical protein
MADESMQTPDDTDEDVLQPDTEIPVRIDSLEADGTRPRVGDEVTIKIDGTIKSLEDDFAYVTCDLINDTDLTEMLAESGQDEDARMQAMTEQADKMATPMGQGGA